MTNLCPPRPKSCCGQGQKSRESGLPKSLAGMLVFGHPVYAIEKRVRFTSEEESDRTYTTTTRSQIHVSDHSAATDWPDLR